MKTAIISSGVIADYDFHYRLIKGCDFVICADGGIRYAYHMNVVPNVIIGDLDSASEEHIAYYKKKAVRFIKYSSDKDKTDTEICLEYAMEFSDEIIMLGAMGSRLDHTLANAALLKLALDKKISAKLIDEKNEVYLINDKLTLTGKKGEIISLLPMSERVEGVNVKGMHYELENACMELGHPYGVSNYFESNTVEISVQKGYLLVIKTED